MYRRLKICNISFEEKKVPPVVVSQTRFCLLLEAGEFLPDPFPAAGSPLSAVAYS